MDTISMKWLVHNWPKKALSFLLAILVWFLVSQSITATKTLYFIPVRVINLPADKTILGLQPNGYLEKRVNLTVSGSRTIIESLEPGDLEVLLNAAGESDQWIVQIGKKNLVSLNPEIDLYHHITYVSHAEFVIHLSRFVTEEIPVTILPPRGSAPIGYQFVGFWPKQLMQTVSGPEEQILALKNKGLKLTFDLSDISKEQLDTLRTPLTPLLEDEISFLIPNQWKQVTIPFLNDSLEPLNDPMAKYLQIDFLRKEMHPLHTFLPVRIFFPLKTSATLNPETLSLASSALIQSENGLSYLQKNLFAQDVSKLFVHLVKDYLAIDIIAEQTGETKDLNWSLNLVEAESLEDAYVNYLLNNEISLQKRSIPAEWLEPHLRQRFREYREKLSLLTILKQKLELDSYIENGEVVVRLAEVNP